MLRRLLPLFCAFLLILASSAFAAGPKTHLPGDLTMEEALAVQKAALEKAKADLIQASNSAGRGLPWQH